MNDNSEPTENSNADGNPDNDDQHLEQFQHPFDLSSLPPNVDLTDLNMSQGEIEKLKRVLSYPWVKAYVENAHHDDALSTANAAFSAQIQDAFTTLSAAQEILEVQYPHIQNLAPVLDDLRSLILHQTSNVSVENLSSALMTFVDIMQKAARDAVWANHATKTQKFITTTKGLRYHSDETVWPYTDGHALMSIIRNGSLWASSPENLNDTSEMKHGLEIIREAFENQFREAKAEESEGAFDPEDWGNLRTVMNEVLDDDYFGKILHEVYYISASTDEDSLTLWRNYAKSDGFAIGIDTNVDLSADGFNIDGKDGSEHLRAGIPPISGWYQVRYEMSEKQELATEFVQNAIEDIDRAGESNRTALVDELRKQAIILASGMKHHAFRDEKEVRWITTNFTRFDPVHYEHGRTSLVPVLHIKTSSDEVENLPVKGIRCSPTAPSGILRTTIGFLLQNKYTDGAWDVRKSKLPFTG